MATAVENQQTDRVSRAATPAAVFVLAAGKLLLHLLTASRYGLFRDEYYYVTCSEHLAWGYVDHPPIAVFIAWLERHLLGSSPLALRFLPAMAGAALVWMAAQVAREMGGGRFAQIVAALAIIPVPIYLILQQWLTMNAFEPLLWLVCAWCVLRAINGNEPRYLFWFGVLVGVGLETKYSIVFLTAGLLVGLLLGRERRLLKSGWPWLGALVAAIIALPNFLWQLTHDFAFLQLMRNVRMEDRDIVRAPLAFIGDQISIMNPVLFPLWLGGLLWLLFSVNCRRYRAMAWAFLFVLIAFIVLKGKNYYVTPVYPIVFAAGAVGFEQLTRISARWLRTAYVAAVAVAGLLYLPVYVPILSPENYLKYQATTHIPPVMFEKQQNGPLPQYFADEFGWPEMVEKVAAAYNSLPENERAHAAIFCNSWGEAAAVDFYGPKYGLPKAISNHNSYWYWGPRDYTGDVMLVLGSNGRGDREHFRSVEPAGKVGTEYSRRDEHFTIWICKGLLLGNLKDVWPRLKKFS